MEQLRAELHAYYRQYRQDALASFPAENMRIRTEIMAAMDEFAAEHPTCHPSVLKARLQEEMAERFQPIIFPHSPFFYEMGLRTGDSWGTPWPPAPYHIGTWARQRRFSELEAMPEQQYFQALGAEGTGRDIKLWSIWAGFDEDHHSLGTTHLLLVGVNGLLAEIAQRQTQPCTAHEAANLEAMARGCRAVLRVAERFGDVARAQLATETDTQARTFLTMIAEASQQVPAKPPRTFYEGLAMLWFLREVTATFEAIGISVLGHLDRQLIDLYRADLAAGRLTEDGACDLLARWMLPTDIKFHVEDSHWPETSTCMELGGCDEDGQVVWNELTRLCIEVHRAHGLISPKLNCRYSAQAPQDYLDLICESILAGHNHFALLNDDVLIPACVRAGKSEREARLYVNGGCQETIVEGVEHSAGAYFYLSLPRVLDLCLRPPDGLPESLPQEAAQCVPQPVEAATFAEFYAGFMGELQRVIRTGAGWVAAVGRHQWEVHPCPFFSATLAGCIEHGLDYTQGGAKYNNSSIAMAGLGTIIDSLTAIRVAVYEEGWLSLAELRRCLAANWEGYEDIRIRLQRLPKFGHGDATVDALAARFAREIGEFVRTVPSERGGVFQASFFVYYAFQWFAATVRATPDGRGAGDLLTQGIAPSRVTPPESLTDIFHTLSRIDFRDFPGNAVLDLQLPAGANIPVATLSAVMRTFAKLGGPTLQPNLVSVEQLRDAQHHPDQHRQLTVRISGLSAYFVTLERYMQDELISRALVAV